MRILFSFFFVVAMAACAPRTPASPPANGPVAEKTTLAALENGVFTAGIFEKGRLVATPRPIQAPTGEMTLLLIVSDRAPWAVALAEGKKNTGPSDFDKLVASNRMRIGKAYAFDDGTYGIVLHFPGMPDDPHPTALAFSSLEHVQTVHLRQVY
jgi:hypothetical protein